MKLNRGLFLRTIFTLIYELAIPGTFTVNLFLSGDDDIYFFFGLLEEFTLEDLRGVLRWRNGGGWYDLSADRMTNKLHSPMSPFERYPLVS